MLKDKFPTIHFPVFLPAAGIILLFAVLGITFTNPFNDIVGSLKDLITNSLGWYFTLVVTALLIASLYFLFGRFGTITLGKKGETPDYSFLAWIAMLFSAGMGIGLMFYGVAEPLLHYANPPVGKGETTAAVETAMNLSFFHWGLHAWAIYAIIGLALAFFSFRKGFPMSIRYTLYPLFGDKVKGKLGDLIDVITIVGTLFGIATSLGLGVMQINTGLNYLTGLENSLRMQVILIGIITLIATASVVSGLKKGIKWLSVSNVGLAGFLMLFVLLFGPTIFILELLVQSVGTFLQNIVSLSLWNEAVTKENWQASWTIFYWAWWISWAPYVGLFIARISKGRSLREFISVVLILPSLVSFLWFSIMGGTALDITREGNSAIMDATNSDVTFSLFALLAQLPLTTFMSGLAVLVILTFFVTSSDSGSLVIDILASGGNTNPPVAQRIFWALLEGVVAAVLLIGGGLQALQTGAITIALPFSLILLLICFSIYRGLQQDEKAKAEALN